MQYAVMHYAMTHHDARCHGALCYGALCYDSVCSYGRPRKGHLLPPAWRWPGGVWWSKGPAAPPAHANACTLLGVPPHLLALARAPLPCADACTSPALTRAPLPCADACTSPALTHAPLPPLSASGLHLDPSHHMCCSRQVARANDTITHGSSICVHSHHLEPSRHMRRAPPPSAYYPRRARARRLDSTRWQHRHGLHPRRPHLRLTVPICPFCHSRHSVAARSAWTPTAACPGCCRQLHRVRRQRQQRAHGGVQPPGHAAQGRAQHGCGWGAGRGQGGRGWVAVVGCWGPRKGACDEGAHSCRRAAWDAAVQQG